MITPLNLTTTEVCKLIGIPKSKSVFLNDLVKNNFLKRFIIGKKTAMYEYEKVVEFSNKLRSRELKINPIRGSYELIKQY